MRRVAKVKASLLCWAILLCSRHRCLTRVFGLGRRRVSGAKASGQAPIESIGTHSPRRELCDSCYLRTNLVNVRGMLHELLISVCKTETSVEEARCGGLP